MKYSWIYGTPLGNLTVIVNDTHLLNIMFGKVKSNTIIKETKLTKKVIEQLMEYFSKKRTTFDIPIDPIGTTFQKKVWNKLLEIPYGKTISYKELAVMVKNKDYSRAVGMANNKNPLPIIIPCHRVIGSNNELVGYAAGLEIKEKLLEIEK